MSLLNKASLIQIPSGYKDGTLYSAKPTNGDGDFTFSRGSNLAATRVNSDGLIEKGRENRLRQSNNFNTLPYGPANATVTSGFEGYDGSNDAWKVASTTIGSETRIRQSQTFTTGEVITLSVYMKKGNVNFGIVRTYAITGGGRAWFDLENGTVETENSGINGSIEDVGNGWYRCSIWGVIDTTGAVDIAPAPADGDYLADAVGEFIYIQDSQLELGLVATDYIETGASTAQAGILEDMPRLDYSGGATCGSLLLEPQRSNVITQSEYFDSSYYTKSFATITTNSTISPDGKQNASELVEDTSNNRHLFFNTSAISGSSSPYTVSIFLKQNTRRYAFLQIATDNASKRQTIVIDLSDGSITDTANTGSPIGVSYNVESFSNGFYRASLTATNTSGGVYIVCGLSNSATPTYNSSKEPIYTGNGSSIYIYGAMLEAGSYATSYIPTYGASVTRGADQLDLQNYVSKGIISDSNEWTIFYEVDGLTTDLDISDSQWLRGQDSTIDVYMRAGNTNEEFARFYWRKDSKYIGSTFGKKIIARLGGGTGTTFADGVEIASSSISGDYSNIGLDMGSQSGAGYVKQAIIFPTALSDDECIQLTTL